MSYHLHSLAALHAQLEGTPLRTSAVAAAIIIGSLAFACRSNAPPSSANAEPRDVHEQVKADDAFEPTPLADARSDEAETIEERLEATNKNAIARALSKALGREVNADHVCARGYSDEPQIIIAGMKATAHSCDVAGVFIDGRFGELAEQTKAVAIALGWESSDAADRQRFALEWTERALIVYSGYTEDKTSVFGRKGRPTYHPPRTGSLKDGGVRVALWFREEEAGKSSARRICHLEVHLGPDASLQDTRFERCFSVPNSEYFRN